MWAIDLWKSRIDNSHCFFISRWAGKIKAAPFSRIVLKMPHRKPTRVGTFQEIENFINESEPYSFEKPHTNLGTQFIIKITI